MPGPDLRSRAPGGPALVVRGLSHRYPGRSPVLDSLAFDVSPGEVVGLMGPNGSGKTTLLRIAAGLKRPSAGEARRFAGEATPPGTRARRTAVVLERVPFAEPLAGGENVRWLLALRGLPADQVGARVERALDDFGLARDDGRPVAAYSHGLRRRLALAEAFAAGADLLLLDEPTLGLDPLGTEALRVALAAACGAGSAALVASNDPGFVSAACGRVLFLHGGRLLADGTPSDLVARLGRDTVIEVEGDPPAGGFAPPPGVRRIAAGPPALRFAARGGTSDLPALCAGLLAAGARPRAIRVREPDLADVFLALAGVPLGAEPAQGEG